jgi:hypothetical protein
LLLKYFKYSIENVDFCCSLPIDKIVNLKACDLFRKDFKLFQQNASEMAAKTNEEIFNSTNDTENCFSFEPNVLESEDYQSIVENMKNISSNLPESLSILFNK